MAWARRHDDFGGVRPGAFEFEVRGALGPLVDVRAFAPESAAAVLLGASGPPKAATAVSLSSTRRAV